MVGNATLGERRGVSEEAVVVQAGDGRLREEVEGAAAGQLPPAQTGTTGFCGRVSVAKN